MVNFTLFYIFCSIVTVYAAGICGAVGVGALGLYCLLCLLHVTMQMGRSGARSLLTRRQVLISKLLFINMAGKCINPTIFGEKYKHNERLFENNTQSV